MAETLTPVLVDAATHRATIRRKVLDGLRQAFPMKTRNFTIELADPRVLEADYSSRQQKQAILEGRTLHEKVQGTLTVKDGQGRVVDTSKNFTLLHLPYFTQRHTFILDGNEYNVSNQIRTKPGVYTRRRGNEDLEAAFNLSKGANFRLSMDPEKGQLHMEYGTTRVPLYPVLRALGVPHQDVAAHWGAEVAAMNRDATRNLDKPVEKLYEKLIPPSKQIHKTIDEKVTALHGYYDNTSMDPEVTERTLGQRFDKVTPLALLSASKKLLDVHRSAIDTDDRDSLEFKTFHSVDDFLKERIGLDARGLRGKIGLKLDASGGDLRKAVPAAPFSRSIFNFLTQSSLSAVPMQINPMELLDQASKVTSLGEGAIASERAIPLEARNLHPTHFAVMDAFRTPESFKAGIDIRTALHTQRDNAGNLYASLRDVKTGKEAHLKPSETLHAVVAFPGERIEPGKLVDVMKNGEVMRVPSSEVTHQVPHVASMYGPTTNLLPFLYGMQGNRIIMASKHQSQALPLVHREAPLVQVRSWRPDLSVEQEMARMVVPTAPVSGRIAKIDADYIYIEPDTTKHSANEDFYSDYVKLGADDGLVRLHYDTKFPLAAKTYLHNALKVKEGDQVVAGQQLADSNFTKDDTLALGKNLRVGYMAYRGLNTNDGLVISQTAADGLVSEHMYKYVMQLNGDLVADREKHRTYFGSKYAARQYNNLDADGVIKPGTVVEPGDPIIVAVRKSTLTGSAALLGKLSKSLVKPFREEIETWDHDHAGTVVDVVKTPQRLTVTVQTRETVNIGDKLSGRYGNKGVIAKIVPDHEMIQDEKGRPIDLLFTSAGISTRINPAQIPEAILGKVAEHTGKPIIVDQYVDGRDNTDYAYKLLADHGLKDEETVFDPVTGRKIPGVFVGKSYILKLFKSTDTNWASHGAERYDVNQQPARGGDEGAKALGKMEFDSLVAHNARNVLRESASIKSQKNDEFWRAVQLGLPTPSPKTPFAYDKFLSMLHGSGVKVSKSGSRLTLGPLTDRDVLKMSSGVIKNPRMLRAKDLTPETGGLFDPTVTGGESGTKWAHVELHEPIVNPVFEEPVRRLLGQTQKGLRDLFAEHGGAHVRDELAKIDIDAKISALRAESKTARGTTLDGVVKQIKYLTALKAQGLTPDHAYILSKLPIAPPVIRPIVPQKDGRLLVGDVNLLYRDALLANERYGEAKGVLPHSEMAALRSHLYETVGAVFGTHDPTSPTAEKRGAKGFLFQITGTRPGNGFFQSKLMKRQQDVSGRATIAPDPTLSMDEIGMPEDMLWGMYSKFVISRLVRGGYSALDAEKMVKEHHPYAREQLLAESRERPVMVNRAPSLHRYNIIGAYPKITDGKTIRLNPFAEKGMNADYDGDAIQVHAPVTAAGIADVKRMTLSHLIFSEKKSSPLNVAPDMEAIVGLHRATQPVSPGEVKRYKTTGEALADYFSGKLALHDPVEIYSPKRTP